MRRVALFLAILSITVGCASAPETEDPERPTTDRSAPEEVAEYAETPAPDAAAPDDADLPEIDPQAVSGLQRPEVASRIRAPRSPGELHDPAAISGPVLPELVLPAPQLPDTRPDISSRPTPNGETPETLADREPPSEPAEPPELPLPDDPVAFVVLEALPERTAIDDDEPEAPPQEASEPEPPPEPQPGPPPEPEAEPVPDPQPQPQPEPQPEPEAEPVPERAQDREDAVEQAPEQAPERDRATTATVPEMPSRPDERERATAVELPEQQQRVGEEFSVELPGSGWVYLGSENGHNRVEFVRRSSEQDHTEFVFRIDEPGDFRLRFQRQDMTRGEIEDHVLTVTTSEDSQERDESNGERLTDAEDTEDDEDGEEPAVGELGADEHLDGPEEPAEVAALAESEIDPSSIPPEELLERAREAAENDEIGAAIAFYEHYLDARNPGSETAHAHFMLGRLYEQRSEHRNLRRSRGHYATVVNEYPVSSYYRPAEQRLRYLERHFFEIR